jgi:hypothetical protein|tara:strand:- start:676 stop:867 length:192 start_codon:yes stop_codon:yes gene_type:complete
MERGFVVNVEKSDTILELVQFYFRTVFKETLRLEKESADNVETGDTIRELALQSIHELLLRED